MPHATLSRNHVGAHLHVREDIVLGLDFAADLDLLEAHGNWVARHVAAWQQEGDAGIGDVLELTASLHDLCGVFSRRTHAQGREGDC
jgi:hypothetical protein